MGFEYGVLIMEESLSDVSRNIIVDKDQNIFLGGFTSSEENIASNGFKNALDTVQRGDGFFAKFNPAGEQNIWFLLWRRKFRCNQQIVIDEQGNIIIAGGTTCNTQIAENAFQDTNFGFEDGFVVKFNPQFRTNMGDILWGF